MKSKLLLIKMLLGLLVLLVVLAIGTSAFFYLQQKSAVSTCTANRQSIMDTARKYRTAILDSDRSAAAEGNFPASLNELSSDGSAALKCPTGGKYYWNPLTGEVYCSILEHNE